MRIGILVLAYNAERTLTAVLDRVPLDVWRSVVEILVLDDHSSDRTVRVAEHYREAHPDRPVSVRGQPRNLGYGGNQKSGYRYGADHGWDVAVMLHADGQYAPEALGAMIAPLLSGEADAVFGSRMITVAAARRGGMPLYKVAGNRLLTAVQNRLSGLALSEWHSGYRAYRVDALTDLPLEANSDGFDFDTEIILQLHAARRRIVEIPIDTYYGDEVCHVNGPAYARDILLHSVRYRLGARGFGEGRLATVSDPPGPRLDPHGPQARVLRLLADRRPSRVLDVGCGPGWLADRIRRDGHEVVGVDVVAHPDVGARTDHFVQADLDGGLPDALGAGFDVIVATDVIGHVRDPERLLRELSERLAPGGVILVSVPNIGHWYARARMGLGFFDYDQRGLLDRGHLRFFTRKSFLRLVRRCRLEPRSVQLTGLPGQILGTTPRPRGVRARVHKVDLALVRLWPTLFAYQFLYELAVPATATEHRRR